MLCEPDDVKSLADALEALLQDGQMRERLITSGIARVRAEFTAVRMAERFEALLVETRKA